MGGLQLGVVPVDRLDLVVCQVVVSRDQRLVVVYLLFLLFIVFACDWCSILILVWMLLIPKNKDETIDLISNNDLLIDY